MTKSALAEVYDIHSFEKVFRYYPQKMWTPKVVNLTLEEAIKSDDSNKRYKALFRGVTLADKKEFKDSSVVLPISIGQKYHEEGEFEATIKLVNKSFKACTILVADTLRRHSLDLSESETNEQTLFSLARLAGNKWLERNIKAIETLSVAYEISRWDDWIGHPQYNFYYSQVLNLYNNDNEYKNVVHGTIEEFLSRSGRYNTKNNRCFDSCLHYVLEESAVTCLWVKAGFKFDIYPTGDNKAMMQAYERLIGDSRYRSLTLNIKKL